MNVCSNCGYCPCCGRKATTYPYVTPIWPNSQPYLPWYGTGGTIWQGDFTITTDATSGGSIAAGPSGGNL